VLVVGASFVDPGRRRMALYRTAVMLLSLSTLLLTAAENSRAAQFIVLVPLGLLAASHVGPVLKGAPPGSSRPMIGRRGSLGRFRGLAHAVAGVGIIAASMMFVLGGPSSWLRSTLAVIAVLSGGAEAMKLSRLIQAERASS
jgi:hypothetical protein